MLSEQIKRALQLKEVMYRGVTFRFKGSKIEIPPYKQERHNPDYIGSFEIKGENTDEAYLEISSAKYPAIEGKLKMSCKFINEKGDEIPIRLD